MPDTWKSIVSRKQQERLSRIPKEWLISFSFSNESGRQNVLSVPRECGLLSKQELHITEDNDATALVSQLASGKLKSVDVVTAFCKRAAIAQQVTNCLTEIFFQDGIQRAKELDEIFQKTGRPVGPLHGLPVSIKDTFEVKGYDTSLGYASLCFQPAKVNSALVELLLAQGAVLYCKTNIPLALVALDSHNNVFGRTLNPANLKLTAGGSSGGEGALVAMRGSPLGIGTDVGGSIRVPAMCNGLVGVKPSHGRTPYTERPMPSTSGGAKLTLETTAGPIATNVRDCELLLRVVAEAAPWMYHSDVVPQTWEQQPALGLRLPRFGGSRTLRIGVARTDGHVTPLPPVQALLDEVARELRQPRLPTWEKIEVVDVDISRLGPVLLKCFNGLMSLSGANPIFDMLEASDEPISPWLKPRLRRRAPKTMEETRKLQAQKQDLQMEFLKVWKESGGYWLTPDSKKKSGDRTLDAIICPVAPHPVAAIDRWNSTNYTSAFNMLDMPAGVLPVRPIRERDLETDVPRDREPLNAWDKTNQEMWTDVDRRIYLGSVLSIQVLTPKLMDRKLVETMAVLEKALSGLREDGLARSSRL